MLRSLFNIALILSFGWPASALPAAAQNNKEIPPVALRLTASAQNLGSPCEGKPEMVCIKVNWTVNQTPLASQINEFSVVFHPSTGNPTKPRTLPATARTTTFLAFPQGTFKATVKAHGNGQLLASAETTGNLTGN